MGTIDLMLAKVREQLSSIYKQLEMDQGVGKAASNVWEFLKEKFDLQAKSLNISLDNLKEQSEKFYANVITPQVEENVMQRINSMWQQVYDEMSNVKTILSNKEQLSKALETLKANITDKSPESVKTIINELTKGGSSEKQNLMNLISIAVGKRWAELMEHPEEIAKLLKMSN
ncbi:Laminin subunit [Trichinella spiralis]|uniref:Laminin subunit n=1 Tax=Trichinella spiralis TaxID=6334 RepID=A0ABR3K493_TRISP